MSKMKKARQDLSKLEKYLSREVARLEKLAGRRVSRKSHEGSVAGKVVQSLMARKQQAEADLAQVTEEMARLEDRGEAPKEEPVTVAAEPEKPARKPRRSPATAATGASAKSSERANDADQG